MRTPKVDTPKPKSKFLTPQSGLIRKSLGQTSTKSLKKLANKGTEQVLSFVKDNEENVEFKSKTPKKLRMSLPVNELSGIKLSPGKLNGKTPKKSPKSAFKNSPTPEFSKSGKKSDVPSINSKNEEKNNTSTPELKEHSVPKTPKNKNNQENIKTPASAENNTSPVKKSTDSKMAKVPLNFNDSLVNKTPKGFKQNEQSTPDKSKPKSPEVELGLQLEEALSPKSKKEKKSKILRARMNSKLVSHGKIEVLKRNINSNPVGSDSVGDTESKKKLSRRRKRKNNSQKVERKPSILKHINALNAVNALLKTVKQKKTDVLATDQYIYLQFNVVKHSQASRGVYKVLLPHCILPDSPEVCLITPDLKGKRNEPEESIDHYKEILKQNNITIITEIIPFRKLKQEYSQFEERKKLADRFDFIISDGSVSYIARIGKKFAKSKKCVTPICFTSKTLKGDVERSLRKVAVFSSGKGGSFSIKCGRIGMASEAIADNIVTIGEFLANNETLIGEPLNISNIGVKTAISNSFPVYVSTVSPNEVRKPKGKEIKVEKPVEDEVTTVNNATVIVYPSGNIKIKKRKNEGTDDIKETMKIQPIKKAKTNSLKGKKTSISKSSLKEAESSEAKDLNSSNEENSDEENSVSDSGDNSDFAENDLSDEEDDVSPEDDGVSSEEDDVSAEEEEIEAAEKAYLKELRVLQDGFGKQKVKKTGVKIKEEDKKLKLSRQQSKKQPKAVVKGKKDNLGIHINQQVAKKEAKEEQGGKKKKGKQLNNQMNRSKFQKGSPKPGRKQMLKGPTGKKKN